MPLSPGKLERACALILALFSTVLVSCGTTPSRSEGKIDPKLDARANALFERFKPAVVKIRIEIFGVPLTMGAGFFVSDSGALFTNLHVMEGALDLENASVIFELSDGRKRTKFSVGGCGGKRHEDICYLKLPIKPKSFFQLSAREPRIGQTAFAIGHPLGLDYSLASGMLSGARDVNGVPHVQVETPLHPGNSGGPIYDGAGNLVGMSTFIIDGSGNLNFGIAARVLDAYARSHRKFLAPAAAKRIFDARRKSEARALARNTFEAALGRLARGQGVGDLLPLQATLQTSGGTFTSAVPEFLGNCRPVPAPETRDIYQLVCLHSADPAGTELLLRAFPIGADEVMGQLRVSQMPLIPSGHSLIREMLEKTGKWNGISTHLSPAQAAVFEITKGPVECEDLQQGPWKGLSYCTQTARNIIFPGSYGKIVFAQYGAWGFTASLMTNSRERMEGLAELPKVILASMSLSEEIGAVAVARLRDRHAPSPTDARGECERMSASGALKSGMSIEQCAAALQKNYWRSDPSHQSFSPRLPASFGSPR